MGGDPKLAVLPSTDGRWCRDSCVVLPAGSSRWPRLPCLVGCRKEVRERRPRCRASTRWRASAAGRRGQAVHVRGHERRHEESRSAANHLSSLYLMVHNCVLDYNILLSYCSWMIAYAVLFNYVVICNDDNFASLWKLKKEALPISLLQHYRVYFLCLSKGYSYLTTHSIMHCS
jgi:hypothetical protein